MNDNTIGVGDMVDVTLVYHQNDNPTFFQGIVLYTPCATGDCWHIQECGDGGRLRYVQTFADITLIKKAQFP